VIAAETAAARTTQGEALAVWAMWGALALAVAVTYSRVDTDELYNVSRQGLAGGLGRTAVLFNYPIVFVGVATTLVAMAALPRRAWLAAAPAIACSAIVPFVVDQDDLDARPANAIPVAGVLVAFALTLVAARRAGAGFAPWRPGDPVRIAVAILVFLVSLPWLTAAFGLHFPGDFFMGEELRREPDGTLLAAVHLGHHHGMDGALLVLTALLLSRARIPQRRLSLASTAYLGLMLAYGAVNCAQDLWYEQVVKRGWTDESIPNATVPGFEPVWAAILLLAIASTFVLLREERDAPGAASYSGA
jgi:hypothetical protein